MEWLTELLRIDTPENMRLQAAEFGFRGMFPWWLAALLILAVAVAAFFLYAQERARLGTLRLILLALLRTALLSLVLLLLFRPVLLAEFQGERPQGIVLLLDNSQSMRQEDKRLTAPDRLRVAIAHGLVPAQTILPESATAADLPAVTPKDPSRAALVKAVLSDGKRNLLAELQKRGPLRPFLFGTHLHSVIDKTSAKGEIAVTPAQVLAAYNTDDSGTALGDALTDLLLRKDGDLPSAIVVMTDGQDNTGKYTLEEAARECARLKVPLHIYGIGSAEGGSLQLRDIGVPETIFFEDAVAVPVRWRSRGFKKGTVLVRLSLGDKVVAEREVPVRPGEDLHEVMTFTPQKGKESEEKLNLAATIQLKENDAYKDTLTRPVRITDRKVRILYIENSPRWEYKFLQTALLRDRRVEINFLLVNGDPRVLQAGPPFLASFPSREELLTYDLLILGDVPSGYLGTEHMEWIQEFVKDFKGGLIWIAGQQHAPATYDNTPLAELLPVEFLPVRFKSDSEARPQPYQPLLTTAGESADMLALADTAEENLKVWRALPGFYWHYPVTRLRPAATALLVHPRARMGEQPMPLIATQFYGKGQVLFLATDETWRWRYNAQDRHFARFWGQVIYQLGLPHLLGNSSQRMQAALERSEAVLDRPGSIYVRLLDKAFHPLRDPEVPAELTSLDAKPSQEAVRKVKLLALPDRDGDYRVLLPHDTPGRFELKVPGLEQTFSYRVQLPPRHELQEAPLAEDALREAARVSGGKFYREENLQTLPDDIKERKNTFTLRQEVLLWNPLSWLLFVGLITVEWVVRKFSNLS